MRNRLRYTIYGFILAFVLSACGGPLDKSVTESLTPEESDEVGQKFPDFVGVYERFIFPEVRKWDDHSLYKQKLKKLTYGDFMEFYNLVYHHDWKEQLSREWEERFDLERITRQLDGMVDSLITYWDNYIAENAPSTYVSVELLEIKKTVWDDPEWNIRKLDATAQLKVVPLRGTIDKRSGEFTLYRTDKTDADTYTLAEHLGSGKIEIETPFDVPIVVECKLSVSSSWFAPWYDYVCDTPADVLTRKCKLHTGHPELMVKGKKVRMPDLWDAKPSYLERYKDARSKGDTSSSDYKLYREQFIKEHIDKEYMDRLPYIEKRELQMLYEHNPLAFSLFYSDAATQELLMEWGWK